MRMTESRLRRIIRSVILENIDDMSDESQDFINDVKDFKVHLKNSMDRTDPISILSKIPKFFRKHFLDLEEPSGFAVKIKISKLRDMGFLEDEIKHLIGSVEGRFRRGGIVSQVFRPIHLKVEE